jgi:hypothetical protein
MGIYTCDYEDCERKPYMECLETSSKDEEGRWWFFCFWHYVWLRIRILFHKEEKLGFARVDSDRETLEHIRQDIWDVQMDLMQIKEKLKIKEKKVTYEEEKPEEKGFA